LRLNPEEVIAQLHKLDEVLAGFNPTLGNLELSKHIDGIVCHPDGRVELCGTMVGLFDGAVELLSRDDGAPSEVQEPSTTGEIQQVKPRRRGRLRVPTLTSQSAAVLRSVDTVLDPERFAGLPEPFFWNETFVMTEKRSWAEEHSEAVYEAKLSTGLSFNKLAERFGMTRPTIKRAYDIAAARRDSAGDGARANPPIDNQAG
jgi:hypothetical protein